MSKTVFYVNCHNSKYTARLYAPENRKNKRSASHPLVRCTMRFSARRETLLASARPGGKLYWPPPGREGSSTGLWPPRRETQLGLVFNLVSDLATASKSKLPGAFSSHRSPATTFRILLASPRIRHFPPLISSATPVNFKAPLPTTQFQTNITPTLCLCVYTLLYFFFTHGDAVTYRMQVWGSL